MSGAMLRELQRFNAVNQIAKSLSNGNYGFICFVERVARELESPIALLSFVKGRQMKFYAAIGTDLNSAERNDTFCTHVLDTDNHLEVCDASSHRQFCKLPVVDGLPGVRYYLGVRLKIRDVGVGALCVLDTSTRQPASSKQIVYLQTVAYQTVAALEYRMASARE